MTETATRVARVEMPEGGVYSVKVTDETVGEVVAGSRAVVAMDYGEDMGRVLEIREYDPAVDGPRVPAYRLLRVATAADGELSIARKKEACELAAAMSEAASRAVPDFRLFYSRLSLGRDRLFVRFLGGKARSDVAKVVDEMREKYGVSVQAWRSNVREAVAATGAVGPCGRVCCCSTWMDAPRPGPCSAPVPHGICGKARCCMSFEQEEPSQ